MNKIKSILATICCLAGLGVTPQEVYANDINDNSENFFEVGKYWILESISCSGKKEGEGRIEVMSIEEEDGMCVATLAWGGDISRGIVRAGEKDNVIYYFFDEAPEFYEGPIGWVPLMDFNYKVGDVAHRLSVINEESINMFGVERLLIQFSLPGAGGVGKCWLKGIGSPDLFYMTDLPIDRPISSRSWMKECGIGDRVLYTIDELGDILGQPASVKAMATECSSSTEYFTLEGIRVAEPQPGQLLIRRQGAKADKVIF